MNSLLVQLLHVMPSNIVKVTNLTAPPPIYNQSMLSNDISVISGKSYMSFEFPDKPKFPPGLKSHFGGAILNPSFTHHEATTHHK